MSKVLLFLKTEVETTKSLANTQTIFLIWENPCIMSFLKLNFALLRPLSLTVSNRQVQSGKQFWVRQTQL